MLFYKFLLLNGKCAFKFNCWQKFFMENEDIKGYFRQFELICKLFNLSIEKLPTNLPTVLY
jgi:hypothetical protein